MKTEQIIVLVVAFFLGMLLLNTIKGVCGCDLVEGQGQVGCTTEDDIKKQLSLCKAAKSDDELAAKSMNALIYSDILDTNSRYYNRHGSKTVSEDQFPWRRLPKMPDQLGVEVETDDGVAGCNKDRLLGTEDNPGPFTNIMTELLQAQSDGIKVGQFCRVGVPGGDGGGRGGDGTQLEGGAAGGGGGGDGTPMCTYPSIPAGTNMKYESANTVAENSAPFDSPDDVVCINELYVPISNGVPTITCDGPPYGDFNVTGGCEPITCSFSTSSQGYSKLKGTTGEPIQISLDTTNSTVSNPSFLSPASLTCADGRYGEPSFVCDNTSGQWLVNNVIGCEQCQPQTGCSDTTPTDCFTDHDSSGDNYGSFHCNTASPGYYIDGDTPGLVLSCDDQANCNTYSNTLPCLDGNIKACGTAAPGYYVDVGIGSVNECINQLDGEIEKCKTYSPPTTCLPNNEKSCETAAPGYYIDGATPGSVQSCDPQVDTAGNIKCNSYSDTLPCLDGNIKACAPSGAEPGYYVGDNGLVQPCGVQTGCSSPSDGQACVGDNFKSCDTVDAGYYVDSTGVVNECEGWGMFTRRHADDSEEDVDKCSEYSDTLPCIQTTRHDDWNQPPTTYYSKACATAAPGSSTYIGDDGLPKTCLRQDEMVPYGNTVVARNMCGQYSDTLSCISNNEAKYMYCETAAPGYYIDTPGLANPCESLLGCQLDDLSKSCFSEPLNPRPLRHCYTPEDNHYIRPDNILSECTQQGNCDVNDLNHCFNNLNSDPDDVYGKYLCNTAAPGYYIDENGVPNQCANSACGTCGISDTIDLTSETVTVKSANEMITEDTTDFVNSCQSLDNMSDCNNAWAPGGAQCQWNTEYTAPTEDSESNEESSEVEVGGGGPSVDPMASDNQEPVEPPPVITWSTARPSSYINALSSINPRPNVNEALKQLYGTVDINGNTIQGSYDCDATDATARPFVPGCGFPIHIHVEIGDPTIASCMEIDESFDSIKIREEDDSLEGTVYYNGTPHVWCFPDTDITSLNLCDSSIDSAR